MKSADIRRKFIEFFKARGHVEIPSASLVPENDPTTLFTSSGMQPLVPYLLGQPHPLGKRLVNSQKAFRAQDIEEVGDNRHTTFFEMLGNWSFGDYFKKEQLSWIWEFLTGGLGLRRERLYVSIFEGDKDVPRDEESVQIWKKLGVPEEKIFYYDVTKNWWSRAGEPSKMPAGEPGGPDSEVFYEFTQVEHDPKFGKACHPNCECGRFMEIANSVFMQYRKTENGDLTELPKKNVDFGGGLERMTAATNDNPDVFQTDLFARLIHVLENASFKKYGVNGRETTAMRIIADHIRAAVMLMSDGVMPGNKTQGSTLRRLISRILSNADELNIQGMIIKKVAKEVIQIYMQPYPQVVNLESRILSTLEGEEARFREKIKLGVQEMNKVRKRYPSLSTKEEANDLMVYTLKPYNIKPDEFLIDLERMSGRYTSLGSVAAGTATFQSGVTYGLPLEYSLPIVQDWVKDFNKDDLLKSEMTLVSKHHELSRTAAAGMFKGGLADHSREVTKLHTATHLLHQTLRTILGPHVSQKGSNITAERLRFDFAHPTKVTDDELKRISDLVNKKIKEDLPVSFEVMDKDKALSSGAMAFFGERYGDKVKVYKIGDFSKEICGGPHVDKTGVLGTFTITKEESLGAGMRRIYATLSSSL